LNLISFLKYVLTLKSIGGLDSETSTIAFTLALFYFLGDITSTYVLV